MVVDVAVRLRGGVPVEGAGSVERSVCEADVLRVCAPGLLQVRAVHEHERRVTSDSKIDGSCSREPDATPRRVVRSMLKDDRMTGWSEVRRWHRSHRHTDH